jgi:hypothetical protein
VPEPGEEFDRESTTYQMFRIYESVNATASNTMVVAFYDKAAAAADGKHLKYFLQLPKYHEDSNFENVHPDFVSVALYGEVISWIQRCARERVQPE